MEFIVETGGCGGNGANRRERRDGGERVEIIDAGNL